jgi:hypothetical protein
MNEIVIHGTIAHDEVVIHGTIATDEFTIAGSITPTIEYAKIPSNYGLIEWIDGHLRVS